MRLLVSMGARRDNIYMLDRRGVIYTGREGVNAYKQEFAVATDKRSLADAIQGADVFIGLSGADLLSPAMLLSMADRPVVFACSNPDPEIRPEVALATRDDLIIATGRSDYPNQVNNVLGFPFIFRGALDVRAALINEEMKVAAVLALSQLAREPVPAEVLAACELDALEFGRDYIIPKPLDPRLLTRIAPAVARAAVDSGVARLPYPANYQPTL
jgi:malate dehydrogenase (oxaloacetate-decarboxylating)(NADP+)